MGAVSLDNAGLTPPLPPNPMRKDRPGICDGKEQLKGMYNFSTGFTALFTFKTMEKRNLFLFSKRIIALYLKAEKEKKHRHATWWNRATSKKKKKKVEEEKKKSSKQNKNETPRPMETLKELSCEEQGKQTSSLGLR